jgi:hypothetical protein
LPANGEKTDHQNKQDLLADEPRQPHPGERVGNKAVYHGAHEHHSQRGAGRYGWAAEPGGEQDCKVKWPDLQRKIGRPLR